MKHARQKTKKLDIPYSIFHIPSREGFTIVETLVAIAILLLSITAPLTIAEKGLASAEAARKEITAFYLAQEAVEYVRNVRDTNALSGTSNLSNWLNGLTDCIGSGVFCGIDTTEQPSKQVIKCNSITNSDCRLLQYIGNSQNQVNPKDPLFGIFGHRSFSGWTATDITRKVHITEIQVGKEAEVEVTVVWQAGTFGSRTLVLKENIFNWYVSN